MKWSGLVVVMLAGCFSDSHVPIAPLPPDPTPDQRLALWENYRPHGNVDEIVTVCHRNGGCERSEYRVIIFGDGRIVRDSEDLAPLVAPESETLHHSRRAQQFADRANWWSRIGLVSGITGIVLGLDGASNNHDTELEVGAGLLVGAIVTSYIARQEARNARNATSEAFAAYPGDLAARLRVCSNGLAVVPCEAAPPPAPDPKAPATVTPERTGSRQPLSGDQAIASSPGHRDARARRP